MAMMKTSASPPPTGGWDRIREMLLGGPTGYGFMVLYAAITSTLLLTNSRTTLTTDIIFIFFLLFALLVYRANVSLLFKVLMGVLTFGVVLPYFGTLNPFYIDVATQAGIYVALALGLNVVVGFAGLLDLGFVAFYAVGAYLWAIASTPQITNIFPNIGPVPAGWFYVFILLGLVVGGFFGVLLGLPVLRLRGDYLAIVTLGLGEVIRVLAINLDKPVNITNGAQGIKDIERPPIPFQTQISEATGLDQNALYQLFFYFLVLLLVLLTVYVVRRLKVSRIGRAWTAIREDETAAIAQGIPLVRMKLLAFAVGSSFAGAMGVVFAAKQLFINPPTFDLLRSISILSMVILGGLGNIPGVILGAFLVTLLNLMILPRVATVLRQMQEGGVPIPEAFDPTQYQRLLFGLLLIIMMIFRPEGIMPEDRRRQELHEDEPDIAGLDEEGDGKQVQASA